MITKPTVLVLGAGSTIPYGYPSGAGLVKDIVTNITSNSWRKTYGNCGLDYQEMDALRSELNLSQMPSIDAFLEHRRDEFLKAGKAAIALSLLSKENPYIFNDFDTREKGVYNYLYNNLTTSWEDFRENKLTIVTFNYDRSLEYFLFSALKHSYNKPDSQVAEAIQNIPIIHVHGSLGPLPWQETGGIDYYPLFQNDQGGSEIAQRIKVASENIIIVSEAQPQSKEFKLAINYIKEAERVYFLGFGYYRLNLERLGLSELPVIDESNLDLYWERSYGHSRDYVYDIQDKIQRITKWRNRGVADESYSIKQFRGSAFGLGSAQMKSIQDQWRIGLIDNKCDSLAFLKEYADLS